MKTFRSVCLLALLAFCCSPARAQRPDVWTEVRSPNFVVVSNGGERQARIVAEQFELFRALVKQMLPNVSVDLGKPLVILAARNEKTLKELLPEFWEQKGRVQPAGMFVGNREKLYVALRTDVYDVTVDPALYVDYYPYQVIYHEYMHAILRRNYQNVPVWLSEGFAELFGYSLIRGNRASVGRPSSSHVFLLRDVRPLPIETLLTVDQNSPHYNERNKASVFYAQSWALTHYLLLEEKASQAKLLEKYQRLLSQGLSEKEAAEHTFGDLQKFGKELEAYVRRPRFSYFVATAPPDVDEKAFAARALSAGESAALRGDFQVHMDRPKEARALLEEALRLDPDNAQAYESMGVLHLRNKDWPEAAEWFERAAAQDSKNFMAHYYAALLNVERGATQDLFASTEKHLRRAIELNNSFAPAYSTLAMLLALRDEKLEDALQLARRAAQLEPGVMPHHLNVANVLMRLRRLDEAIQTGERVLAAARDSEDRVLAESFLLRAREYRDSEARYQAARRQAEQRELRLRSDLASAADSRSGPAAEPEPAGEVVVDPNGLQATAPGLVADVTCPGPTAMLLTLRLRQTTLRLRAAQRAHVPYYVAMQPARGKLNQFDPCESLEGLRVEIVYKPTKSAGFAGEILSVELISTGASGNSPARSTPPAPPVATPPSTVAPATGSSPRVGWAEGKVLSVACTGQVMLLVIDFGGTFRLKLRAENYQTVEFTGSDTAPLPQLFLPCSHLKGRQIEARYHVVDGKSYGGDVVAIQLRK